MTSIETFKTIIKSPAFENLEACNGKHTIQYFFPWLALIVETEPSSEERKEELTEWASVVMTEVETMEHENDFLTGYVKYVTLTEENVFQVIRDLIDAAEDYEVWKVVQEQENNLIDYWDFDGEQDYYGSIYNDYLAFKQGSN